MKQRSRPSRSFARGFVVWALCCFGASAANASVDDAKSGALERIQSSGVLRWGGDQQGGEPYVFEDPTHPGRLVGFEVELADAIAKQLGETRAGGVKAEFVQNDWPNLIPSLERGTFDIAMNGIEVTPALSSRVSFSRPYCVFAERLVGRVGDTRFPTQRPTIPSDVLKSLAHLRVGTLAGTQAWNLLLAAGANAIPYEGVEEPFIDLDNERTDAVLLDDIIVDRYVPNHPRLTVLGDVALGTYAIAIRPGDGELLHAINAALARLSASGALRDIWQRWHLDPARQESALAQLAVATTPTTPASATTPGRLRLQHLWLFLDAAAVTLAISVAAMMLAMALGLVLALARVYTRRARWIATVYVELFRGTPVLLQLYVLYYGLAPFIRLNAWGAAVLGLGLNYAAYESEIYRAGIAAVPVGQTEAALSLGISRALTIRRIVLPQALRVALPGIANDFIALLKDSSLVSVITVVELTKRMAITAVDVRGWLAPGLACAALYLGLSYPLSRFGRYLEARLGPPRSDDAARGRPRSSPPR